MKRTSLGKVLLALLCMIAFVILGSCQNSAGSGGSRPSSGGSEHDSGKNWMPKISSNDELDVLGNYKNGSVTLTFNDDLTGNYNDGSSGNIRALSPGSFTWSASPGGIEIKQGSNPSITVELINGTITLDQQPFTIVSPTVDSIRGKNYTLIYPSETEMDRNLSLDDSYIAGISFAGTGNNVAAKLRSKTSSGISKETRDGTWATGSNGYFMVRGDIPETPIKIVGNKVYIYALALYVLQ